MPHVVSGERLRKSIDRLMRSQDPLLPKEQWRSIPEFQDWYSISNLGRVRRDRSGKGTTPGWILKLKKQNKTKYLYVKISIQGFQYCRLIHVMVAEAFLGANPKGLDVNHKDTNKENNRIDNLEYMTRSENMKHSYQMGTHPKLFGANNPRWKGKKI